MDYDKLKFEVRDGVAHLTLDRPEAANAIDLGLARELVEASKTCDSDPRIRAVLLSGAGRMFSAGGDLKSFAKAGDRISDFVREVADTLHAALSRFARMDAPLVGAVNGPAAGAGMSLVAMTDLAIAAESAHFTMAYTAAGLTPDGSSTWYLPRLVGMRRAKELMLTNRRLSAGEALEWGIVQKVVPDESLLEEAAALAGSLAAGPTRAFGATKKLLLASEHAQLEAQMDAETDSIVDMTRSEDGREGLAAFLGKRKPEYHGR
jgi:2-(1,2-epoxy-1,2-dihydrophenyl)acetyl-CoA isomerase